MQNQDSSTLAGVEERPRLASWIEARPAGLDCIQVVATQGSGPRFRLLSEAWPLILRDLGLSLGTPGALDQPYLHWFLPLVKESHPAWITTPLGFSRTCEVQLGFPAPICPSQGNQNLIADHLSEISGLTNRPLLLENVTSALQFEAALIETEFIGRLCSLPGCGLALNLGALYASSENLGFDPFKWFQDLDPGIVWQITISGYKKLDGYCIDSRSDSIPREIWQLADDVFERVSPKALILAAGGVLQEELERARQLLRRTGKNTRKQGKNSADRDGNSGQGTLPKR